MSEVKRVSVAWAIVGSRPSMTWRMVAMVTRHVRNSSRERAWAKHCDVSGDEGIGSEALR